MSGLEKLTQSILNEAKTNAASILDNAKKECEGIQDASKRKCDEIRKSAKADADKKIALMKESSISGAALIKRQELLKTKQGIISDIIKKVYERLYSLDDKEYFETLSRLALKNAHKNEKGEIMLSADDKKRLPDGFAKSMEELGLSVSDRCASLKGGFILVYGGIEENCSFEAVLEGEQNTVTDIVADEMFR